VRVSWSVATGPVGTGSTPWSGSTRPPAVVE